MQGRGLGIKEVGGAPAREASRKSLGLNTNFGRITAGLFNEAPDIEALGAMPGGGNFNRQVTGGAILMCEVMP